jgi:hypothetical protein
MRAYWKSFMLAVAILATTACGGDGGTGPSATDLTGTWQLTKVLFVSQAQPQLSVDLIAQGGTATLTLDPNKDFMVVIIMPLVAPDTTTGTWALNGQYLDVTPTGAGFAWQFKVTVTATTITLANASVDFDVNNDGTDEPAKLTMQGTR